MSDEYQPNDVVDSLPEPEVMPARPVEAESATAPKAVDAASPELAPENPVADEDVSSSDAIETPDATPSAKTVLSDAPQHMDAGVDDSGDGEFRASGTVFAEPASELADDVVLPAEDAPVPEIVYDADRSTIVSLADLEKPRRERARAERAEDETPTRAPVNILASVKSLLAGRGWIVGVILGVLLIIFLFLPPVSLAERLSTVGGGYTTLDGETRFVEHPDGLRVTRADGDDTKMRIKLASVPRADFVAGNAPEGLEGAVTSLPTYLAPKSPYYTLDIKAKEPVAGVITVVIPNEAEPWETLDLYAWDGEAWRWLPTQLDRDTEVLVSTVDVLPMSVIVLQSQASAKRVAAETDVWPVDAVDAALSDICVSGLLIGTLGGTTGQAGALPPADVSDQVALVPIIRNWLPGRDPNWALVSDMLRVDTDRQAHTTNLTDLAQQGGYGGLVVDYRQVQPEDRAAYARFVSELGTAFRAAGLWLGVVVDMPEVAPDGSWNTGGYDWVRLGAAVDQLRVVMPLSPAAYAPGGDAERLVQWAIGQVERHKLMLVYSTLSRDGEQPCGLDTVLASVGELQVTETLTESVLPGRKLNLSLDGSLSMEMDPATAATRVSAGGKDYWLGTPQWLAARMDLANRYLLGGVVLRDIFDTRNLAGLSPVISAYQVGEVPNSPTFAGDGSPLADMSTVVWSVTDPKGKTSETEVDLSQPAFAWTAPAITGTYRVAATVAGLDKGSVDITVAVPAPVVTDTLAEGEAGETSAEDAEVEDAEDLSAGFVTDVTVPDNTRFEKGEEFVKTWRMKNDGDVDWPKDTVMAFASGAELGKSDEVEVGAVKAGETIDIEVEMQAPDEDGAHRSVWELRTGGKAIAGGAAYVLIQVGEEVAQPDTPAQAPPPAPLPVASGSFELGGHIRDMGLPYREKMHYAGMNWAKLQVFYGQGADTAIATAHANGFKIQLSAIGGADMVDPTRVRG